MFAHRLGCSSHIVNHLVRAKHKEVMLHKDSALGDTFLEVVQQKLNISGKAMFF